MKPKIPLVRLIPPFALAFVATVLAGTVKVQFEVADGAPSPPDEVVVSLQKREAGQMEDVGVAFHSRERSFATAFEDLAEGSYYLTISSGLENPQSPVQGKLGGFSSRHYLRFGPDDEVKERKVVYDPRELRGSGSATVRLLGTDKKPVSGETLVLAGTLPGPSRTMIRMAEARTAAEGTWKIEDLNQDIDYQVFAGDGQNWTRLKSGQTQTFYLRGDVQPGDQAPDIEFLKLKSDVKGQLTDYSGQVVVLDFWASWCGPCQGPMEKMQTYAEKHPEWGDRVALVALSIDDTEEAARGHLKKQGWNKTINVWAEGWQSFPPKRYGVSGIPTAFIIAPDGKVAHRGHPASLDIPELVGELLPKKDVD